MRKINELFSDIIPFETFESCIGTPGDFESLLGVSTDRFQHCLTSCFSTEEDERSKRSSWLGFLLSDGAQVDALSSSLSETINSYNTNFNKIQDIDKKLIIKFNELALKLSDMSSTEHLFRDLILSIQIQQQQDKNRQIYLNLKSHHMTAILNMLEKSTLHEEIDIIQRSLFHQNQCGLVFCETDIFSRREQGKIVVHRELLKLAPSMDLYVQCKALSPTHVSQYHNTVGQNAGPDKIVLLGKVIQIASLSNTTFVNLNTRMIKSSEKFLDNFIIFQRNLQCLIPTTIILNKVEQSCRVLQVLKLEDGFELEANSKTLTDFHIQASLN